MPQSIAVYSIEICNSPANRTKVAFKWLQSKNAQTKILAVFSSLMISIIPEWIYNYFSGLLGEVTHLLCQALNRWRGSKAQWLGRAPRA